MYIYYYLLFPIWPYDIYVQRQWKLLPVATLIAIDMTELYLEIMVGTARIVVTWADARFSSIVDLSMHDEMSTSKMRTAYLWICRSYNG